MSPTMTDVARVAGVSQSCVSLVLNDAPGARVPEATRIRVIKSAEKIGYELPGPRRSRRQEVSSAPVTAQSAGTLGFMVDEMSVSPHSVLFLDGARDAAWTHERTVQAYVTRSHAALENSIIELIRQDRSIAGVIYASSFNRQIDLPVGLEGIPTVLLNCYTPKGGVGTVLPDDFAGGFSSTQYLLLYGHRRVAIINGERWMDASRDRLRGYRQALSEADVDFDSTLVKYGDWSVSSGYVRARSLLSMNDPPTAFYCANDLMAWGCLKAADEAGYRVPEDISVVGHNDVDIAANTSPPLTTYRPASYEMGRQAVEALLDFEHSGKAVGRTLTDGQLIVRSSVSFAHPPERTELPEVQRAIARPRIDQNGTSRDKNGRRSDRATARDRHR